MADHMSYEESKRFVFRGLGLLAVITLIEVFFSLAGKGYVPGLGFLAEYAWIGYIIGAILIGLSLYKAYFIIYDFMHLRYEVKSMAATILLPVGLLFWAMVAFFQEGGSWGERRELIAKRNRIEAPEALPGISPVERVDTEPLGTGTVPEPTNED